MDEVNDSAQRDTRDAIFDYMNRNPNRFRGNGESGSHEDSRDLVPALIGAFGAGNAVQRAAQRFYIDKFLKRFGSEVTPSEVIDKINKKRFKNWQEGAKHSPKQCRANWAIEKLLCAAGYIADDYFTCKERASHNFNNCVSQGDYNGLGIWTLAESTGQPQGKEDPDRSAANLMPDNKPEAPPQSDRSPIFDWEFDLRRRSAAEFEPAPDVSTSWMAKRGIQSPLSVERSDSPELPFGRETPIPPLPLHRRLRIRATPGMGMPLGQRIISGGSGGKRPLAPRGAFDPLAPTVLY